MIALRGVYNNGTIVLREKIETVTPVEVIVTFLDDVKAPVTQKMDLSRFSFMKSRELLKEYSGSLSDAVIEERRSAV